jgi:hypothetical protein
MHDASYRCDGIIILNYSKKVRKHSVQQPQFLSSHHRVVLLWYTQIMAFIEVPVDNIMSRLQCSTFSALFRQKTCCGKNAEAA